MDLTIFLILVFLAFGFLIATLFQNDNDKVYALISLPLLAAVIFGVLALTSFDVQQTYCENAITNSTFNALTNVTTYQHSFTCDTNVTKETYLSYLFDGMFLICIVILFIRAFSIVDDFMKGRV